MYAMSHFCCQFNLNYAQIHVQFLLNSIEEITLRLFQLLVGKLFYFVSLMNYILNFITTFLEQSEFLVHESHHYYFIMILFLFDTQ